MVNLLKGKGCVAPDERLPVFVEIYNKESYKAELLKKEQERQYKGYSNSYGINYDYNNNKLQQQYSYVQRRSEPWSNKVYQNNSWEQKQYFDNSQSFKNYYRQNKYWMVQHRD